MIILEGQNLSSSWCVAAYLVQVEDDQPPQLAVEFKSATCLYPDAGREDYEGIINSDSPGGYVHEFLYNLPYRRISL